MNHAAIFAITSVFLSFSEIPAQTTVDHSLLSDLLRDHAKQGVVDYAHMKSDDRLDRYLETLSSTDPSLLASDDTLAFWINVYNAFTLKIVCDNYPVESITDLSSGSMVFAYIFKTSVWDKKFVQINKRNYSLNDIEHDIIRASGDPRIHFALVCASKSCPPLRSEAFVPGKLDQQLEDQGRLFIRNNPDNQFDLSRGKVMLSKIFDWYEDDFESTGLTLIQFVAQFLPAEMAAQIKQMEHDLDIEYSDYDWSLNE